MNNLILMKARWPLKHHLYDSISNFQRGKANVKMLSPNEVIIFIKNVSEPGYDFKLVQVLTSDGLKFIAASFVQAIYE
jgi:hypothetical protein